MKTKKFCTNPACSLKNNKVTTELKKCIGCEHELKSDFEGLGSLEDLFKGTFL